MTRPLAVVDIDGVVADVRHRLHHLDGSGHKDWPGFFGAAGSDHLLVEGLAVVERLAGDHDIAFLSGRPEWLRATTQAWLADHGLPTDLVLLRPDGDHRPARMFKLGVLHRLRRERTVALLVDDDSDVIEAARAEGFEVFHADWVPRDAPLRAAQRSGRT